MSVPQSIIDSAKAVESWLEEQNAAPPPETGFYVSTTSLENFAFPETRQGRYVDASKIPFIILPFGLGMGLKLGDLCFVYNKATGDNSLAIYADTGPRGQIGEGSIALATALKVPASPRTGGVSAGITYVVFPGSGKGYQEMDVWPAQADRVFRDWGGMPRLNSILVEDMIS